MSTPPVSNFHGCLSVSYKTSLHKILHRLEATKLGDKSNKNRNSTDAPSWKYRMNVCLSSKREYSATRISPLRNDRQWNIYFTFFRKKDISVTRVDYLDNFALRCSSDVPSKNMTICMYDFGPPRRQHPNTQHIHTNPTLNTHTTHTHTLITWEPEREK